VRLYTGRRVHKSSASNGNSNPPMTPGDSAPPAAPLAEEKTEELKG
jgi:hypothetical protein